MLTANSIFLLPDHKHEERLDNQHMITVKIAYIWKKINKPKKLENTLYTFLRPILEYWKGLWK